MKNWKEEFDKEFQTTKHPTTPKSKGIRGMVNPSELLPKKKVVSSLEQEAKKYKSAEEFATSDKHIIDRSGEIVNIGDTVTFAYGGGEFKGKLLKVKNFDGTYSASSVKGKVFKDYSPEVVVEATENVYNKGGFLVHKKGQKFDVRGVNINEYKEDYNPVKTKSQLTDIWNKANAGSKVDPLIMEAKKYKSATEVTEIWYGKN